MKKASTVGQCVLVVASVFLLQSIPAFAEKENPTQEYHQTFDWIQHTQHTLDELKAKLNLGTEQLPAWSTWSGGVLKDAHQQLEHLVDQHSSEYIDTSKQIWQYAELGYHEDRSSALLQRDLKAAGFTLQSAVADEPTGFVASYGQGKPVIAIVIE